MRVLLDFAQSTKNVGIDSKLFISSRFIIFFNTCRIRFVESFVPTPNYI